VITTVLAGVMGPAFILKAVVGGLSRLIAAAMASLPGGVTSAGHLTHQDGQLTLAGRAGESTAGFWCHPACF
jgi:hypothetical protein